MKKNNKDNGVEIIPPSETNIGSVETSNNDSAVSISKDGVSVQKSGNFVVGSLNLVLDPLRRRNRIYYQKNIWLLMADILVIFLIIALAIFLVFFNRWQATKNIVLRIDNIEHSISAGSLESFTLNYQTNIKTTNNSLKISLPENFIIESVYPHNLFNFSSNSFNLGEVEAGSLLKIKVNGFVWGEVRDHQSFAVKLNCDQCGKKGFSNSLFYNIENRAIDINFNIDNNLYLNSEFESSISVVNNTNNDFNNIYINLSPELILKTSDSFIKDNSIFLEKLMAGEKKDLSFWAQIDKEGSLLLKPRISFTYSDKNYSFNSDEKLCQVKKPGFSIDLLSDKRNVYDNEKISYTLKYDNQEKESAKNIEVKISSANPNFLIKSIQSTKQISSANIFELDDLVPQESGEISFDIIYDRRLIQANQELYLKADLSYEIDGQRITYTTVSDKSRLISNVSASAAAYYYSPQGDQLGVGPLPPALDMATNYWIFLEFNNSANELENFVLTAELPDNVYYNDKKRVLDGRLIYSEIGKRLAWEIDSIKGGVNNYRTSFEVTLIPGQEDLGTIPNLLKNIKFTLKDKFTNQDLSGTLSNISTNLIQDRLSSGMGRVRVIR